MILEYSPEFSLSKKDWEILSKFWHQVAYSDLVPNKLILPVELLDIPLLVTRFEGQARVYRDLCPHRGAPLSRGKWKEDDLVCSYHSLRFHADGSCRNSTLNQFPCLNVFPVQKRYGVIWTCLNDTSDNHLLTWKEFERDDLRFMRLDPIIWNCSPSRQVENFNDVSHLSWLHGSTFGNPDKPEIEKYVVYEDGLTYRFSINYERASVENVGRNGQIETSRFDYFLTLPFYSRLTITTADSHQYILFNMASPVSSTKTYLFLRMARNWDLEGDDQETIDLQYKVLEEDRPIVESQRPEELPLDLSEEFHIQSDLLSTHYRKGLVELGLEVPLTA